MPELTIPHCADKGCPHVGQFRCSSCKHHYCLQHISVSFPNSSSAPTRLCDECKTTREIL